MINDTLNTLHKMVIEAVREHENNKKDDKARQLLTTFLKFRKFALKENK